MSNAALCLLVILAAAAMPSHAILGIFNTNFVFVNNGKICYSSICFDCYWLRDICLRYHAAYPSVCHDYVSLCTYTGQHWSYFSVYKNQKLTVDRAGRKRFLKKKTKTPNTKIISKSMANRLNKIRSQRG